MEQECLQLPIFQRILKLFNILVKNTKIEGDRRSAERIKNFLNKKNEGSVYIFELNKKYDIDGFRCITKLDILIILVDPNCEVDIIKNEIWIIFN